LRRAGAAPRKPWWVSFGAELYVVVGLMFSCRVAVADWPRVPSGSMEPTLRVGDYLLVNHLAYGPRLPFTNAAIEFGQPQRGDVVVFRFPLDVSQFYVKRLVGLPGDVVAFRDGAVTVNGEAFDVQVIAEGCAKRWRATAAPSRSIPSCKAAAASKAWRGTARPNAPAHGPAAFRRGNT
jgi:signal peptidase I